MSFPYFNSYFLIAEKMSTHQTSAKPRSSKCRHFCFPFDSHNDCPTCREYGNGDDPCVTNQSPCNICASFSENSKLRLSIGVGTSGNRRHWILVILARKTMWRRFLALKPTFRVLLKIYFLLLPVPNPYVLSLYH